MKGPEHGSSVGTHAEARRLVWRKGELAEALRVSRWTLNRIIATGELATTIVGTTEVIPVAEVERYLRRHSSRARGRSPR